MRLSLARSSYCVFVFIALSSLGLAVAQEQPRGEGASLEAKRRLVRAEMIREFADSVDSAFLEQIDRKVAAMSPQRLDQLVAIYQKRQQSPEAQLEQLEDPAYREALLRQYQARLAAARSGGSPGYAPVITTLPSGAQLGASAVVSPDRRYVRMNLQPFFSSVGPVQNFTFQQPGPINYPYYQPYPYFQPLAVTPLAAGAPAAPVPNRPAVQQPVAPPKKKPAFRGGR
jgi:hypothetical protein